MGNNGRGRRRVEPIDEWEQIDLLCDWPEQRDYELIRPLVLFGSPAAGRLGDRSGLREDAPAQGKPLRGGGDGEPLRLRAR